MTIYSRKKSPKRDFTSLKRVSFSQERLFAPQLSFSETSKLF